MRPFRRPRPDPAAFDAFYLGSRRRLLLQCLALTGDLEASRGAVRDAFVAAHQHWRKVGALEHPEDWVRPRAWAIAQRRSVARIWHREKGLTPAQSAVLDALSSLPDLQRRTVLLAHLAALSLPGIGRELGQTQPATERALQQGTVTLALALDCDSTLIRGRLESLAPVVTRPGLPRVTVVRRNAQRRHRVQQLGASVLGLLLALGAGWFVTTGGGLTASNDTRATAERARAVERPVTAAMLLTAADLTGLSHQHGWRVTDTGDNTAGSGLNTPCQRARFADDRGVAAWVRTLSTTGRSPAQVVQTVEVSATPGAASDAYRTTVAWYADCSAAGGQLLRSWNVRALGDEARAVQVRLGSRHRTWTVVIARTGQLTTRTALGSPAGTAPGVEPLVAASDAALQHLCVASAADGCPATDARAVASLPPAGDVPGMLAAADLPSVPGVRKPWVGTDPGGAVPNLAATTCDHTSFASARSARSRTFLVPEGHLPDRFGLTETYGRFGSTRTARAFVAKVRGTMLHCADKQLGTTVRHHAEALHGPDGSTWSLWRETAQINDRKATVSYWMGVTRVGRYVAQVTLTPVQSHDIGERAFTALVVRARDRLRELS